MITRSAPSLAAAAARLGKNVPFRLFDIANGTWQSKGTRIAGRSARCGHTLVEVSKQLVATPPLVHRTNGWRLASAARAHDKPDIHSASMVLEYSRALELYSVRTVP